MTVMGTDSVTGSPLFAPGLPEQAPQQALTSVAVLGLGYVGLPTSIGLAEQGMRVIGVDVSERRLQDVSEGSVDLADPERERLRSAVELGGLTLTSDPGALQAADAVVICVPTPVDENFAPDLRFIRGACNTVVEQARRDQVIVLTSTTYVGTTRELLIQPLAERGLRAGCEVFVAFSPERIDPGNRRFTQEDTPRVVGGATSECARSAAAIVGGVAARVHVVSSPETAEMTKLYENTFRAVNIAFANEMAGASRSYGLDPVEITRAAATKPYGFMAFQPGPGVGGHCIPCDPHYLLEGLRGRRGYAPVTERAMKSIAMRPTAVVCRALEVLAEQGVRAGEARVLVVGAAYKPGVRDVREAPAVRIMRELAHDGVAVSYHDPLVRSLEADENLALLSVPRPHPADYDLALLVTLHHGQDYAWLDDFDHVLDCTYETPLGRKRALI